MPSGSMVMLCILSCSDASCLAGISVPSNILVMLCILRDASCLAEVMTHTGSGLTVACCLACYGRRVARKRACTLPLTPVSCPGACAPTGLNGSNSLVIAVAKHFCVLANECVVRINLAGWPSLGAPGASAPVLMAVCWQGPALSRLCMHGLWDQQQAPAWDPSPSSLSRCMKYLGWHGSGSIARVPQAYTNENTC